MAMPTGKIIGNKLKSPLFTKVFNVLKIIKQFGEIDFLFPFAHAINFSPAFSRGETCE